MFKMDHNMEDLCGKYLIIYRSILGRKPEVLNYVKCPDTLKEVKIFLRRGQYNALMRYHFGYLKYIPEYKDLDQEKTSDNFKKSMSYLPHTAVYDKELHKVITIHGIMPKVLCKEFLSKDSTEHEIIDVILEYSKIIREYNNEESQSSSDTDEEDDHDRCNNKIPI